MAAQKGKDLLIKIDSSASPGTFITLAGLRTKTMTFNSEMTDITDSDSANRWRELLEGSGVKNIAASGSGIFKDSAGELQAKTDALAGTHRDYQIVVPDFGVFEGPFQIATLQYAGEQNGEVTYEISLESAGEIAFTAT